ncbi:MAG: hypothetical protein Q7S43_02850 [bacterium]|nr:hypothetical protein [bacterium]MDO8496368.1 hypothetical protein [bacterium]
MDINKIRESHVGYLLLSDEEIKQEIKGRAVANMPESGELLVFGAEDWKRYLGIELTAKQLKSLPRFPWGAGVLKSPCPFNPGKLIKETHFAFLGLDEINRKKINIQQLRNGLLSKNCIILRSTGYAPYVVPGYCYKSLQFRWYLMPRKPELSQEYRTFTEAKKAIPKEYEAANAIEQILGSVLLSRKFSEVSNPVLVNDKVQYASNLIIRMSSDNKVTVVKSMNRFKYKKDYYGAIIGRTRVEKNTNLPIAVSRRLKM